MSAEKFELCNHPGLCASSKDGRCTALWKNDDSENCPFFQTAAQYTESCVTSMERLFRLGRFDLLEQYYRISQNAAKRICSSRQNIIAFVRR